jgi:hypothetical protein
MKTFSAVTAAILIAGLGTTPTVYAASSNAPTNIAFVKTRTVKFALRNDSTSAVQLKVGDQVMSLDPGKTVALKLDVGTRIVMNAATPTHPAGELIAQATTELADATLVIK